MRRVAALAGAVGFLVASPAAAQYYDKAQLAKVEEVFVLIVDSIRDGCLPQPMSEMHTLQIDAEQALRRSDIKVGEKRWPVYTLGINVAGYAWPNADSCIATLNIELYRFENLHDGTSGLVQAANAAIVLSGPKDGLLRQVRDAVGERVAALAREIGKARPQ